MSGSDAPLLITVAPNGARRMPHDHPALPLTPKALAETAAACRDAGAGMIHLHVRDDDGTHSLDADAYRAAINAVRTAVGNDMVVQITTESAGVFTRHQQMACVRAVHPEAVSLGLRELIPNGAAWPEAHAFLAWTIGAGIRVQLILYGPDEVVWLQTLLQRGIVPDRNIALLFVLGRYSGQAAEPTELLPFLTAWNRAADGSMAAPLPWSVCAFGRRESGCIVAAAALGGHVRVGFENNLRLADGSLAPDNAALVAQTVQAAALIGRRPANAETVRRQHLAG